MSMTEFTDKVNQGKNYISDEYLQYLEQIKTVQIRIVKLKLIEV